MATRGGYTAGARPARVISLFDTTGFDEALRPDPALRLIALGTTAADLGWSTSTLASAPGDRIFFFATRSYRHEDYPAFRTAGSSSGVPTARSCRASAPSRARVGSAHGRRSWAPTRSSTMPRWTRC